MKYTKEEFTSIEEQVKNKYLNEPFKDLVVGIATPSLREMQRIRKKKFVLNQGESLEDRCFNLYLERRPKVKDNLPKEEQGIRVYYTVSGKFNFLDNR